MSLINQMLRDLEQRRAAEQQQTNAVLRGLAGNHHATNHRRRLIWTLGSIMGILAITAAVITIPGMIGPAANLPPAPTARALTPETITAPPPAPNTITPEVAAIPPIALEPMHTMEAVPPAATTEPPVESVAATPAAAPVLMAARTMAPAEPPPASTPVKQPHPPSLQERYRQALALLGAGRTPQAEILLRAILTEEADRHDARIALGGMLLGSGRLLEAEEVLTTGIQLHPHNLPLALLLSRLRVEQGDENAAIALLEQTMPTQPPADYLAFLAALYQRAARYPASIDTYRKALNLAPTQSAWWLGLAISLEGSGERAAAREAYAHALSGSLAPTLSDYAKNRLHLLSSFEERRY